MRRLNALTLTALFACAIAQAQTEKILYSFSGPDGSTPVADLVMDKAGNLYGTTQWGGSQGFGTVFELSPGQGGTWTENVLYSFCGNNGCTAGSEPMAGLVLDSNGNLYGTTYTGGRPGCPELTTGCGVVFELSPPARPGDAWTESVLYTFCSDDEGNRCLDGGRPVAKLAFDAAGNLYGTTSDGGAQDYGAAFELSPGPSGWPEQVLYSFCAGGQFP